MFCPGTFVHFSQTGQCNVGIHPTPALTCVSFSFLGPPPCTHQYDTLFDFETASELNCFQATPAAPGIVTQSAKTTNPVTVKHGSYSLKWEPPSGSLDSNLKLKFSSGSEIPTNWLRRGGVKVWFYKERPSLGKTLKVEFKNSGILVATFKAHLSLGKVSRMQSDQY